MTPKELAEKIREMIICPDYSWPDTVRAKKFLPKVESLLSSALDEARLDESKKMQEISELRIVQARAEAYEECAKIAEKHDHEIPGIDCCGGESEIADRIRQRAKDLK